MCNFLTLTWYRGRGTGELWTLRYLLSAWFFVFIHIGIGSYYAVQSKVGMNQHILQYQYELMWKSVGQGSTASRVSSFDHSTDDEILGKQRYPRQKILSSPWYFLIVAQVNWNCWVVQGWGLLSHFFPFRYFPIFSEWSKQWLPVWYEVQIWQVSPQLSCGDTWQILTWLKLSDLYIC